MKRELCTYQPKKGKCEMHLTKYFYNIDTKECQFFVYSGCGGNANNFMTVVECESTCKNRTAISFKASANPANVSSVTLAPTTKPTANQAANQASQSQYTTSSGTSVPIASVSPSVSPFSASQPSQFPYIPPQSTPAQQQASTLATNAAAATATPSSVPAATVNYLPTSTVSASTPSSSPQNAQKTPSSTNIPSENAQANATLNVTYTPIESTSTPPLQNAQNVPFTGSPARITHKIATTLPGSKRTLLGTPAREHHPDVTRQFVIDGQDCLNTTYGCCEDGNSPATGTDKGGCPESKSFLNFCLFVEEFYGWYH